MRAYIPAVNRKLVVVLDASPSETELINAMNEEYEGKVVEGLTSGELFKGSVLTSGRTVIELSNTEKAEEYLAELLKRSSGGEE